MQKNQRVAVMADEVLARQAKARVEQSAEPFEESLRRAVLKTEAGRQLGELGDGPHGDDRATTQWQKSMSRERPDERHREERDQAG
jgi:hypothetical protein